MDSLRIPTVMDFSLLLTEVRREDNEDLNTSLMEFLI